MVAALIHTVAADGVIREGRVGRWLADHASNAVARSSADNAFCVSGRAALDR